MGLGDAVDAIVTGESLIIDGAEGIVLRHADPAIQMQYREKERRLSIEREALQKLVDEKPSTRTGRRIEVACNIASGADMAGVLEVGADGVGLFRTEMLFMDRSTPPSEEEQTRVYRQVLSEADDRRVVIRTMDIGGEKPVSYLGIEAEENPFLGYRAIRYLMDHPELLITQFRALLRASDAGNLAIMIPMISHLEEIRWVKDLIQTVEKELEREGHGPFSYELGMMIEVPSAVMMADRFAREVDFFSIGTNDLTGYLLAADRMNSRVASIYDYWDPSVVRAIKRVIDAGKQERIWVGMCGGAAGDPAYAKLLLDLGLDEFSTEPTRVLKLKSIIMAYTGEETAHRLSRVMEADTKEDVKAIYGS
jgi:phosphotransferase system enzyme I (PtsI)